MTKQDDHTDSTKNSFKGIYFEYYRLVARTAFYILKDKDRAEDVAQEVFTKLWERKEKLSSIENVKYYVVQMSRNTALNQLKHNTMASEDTLLNLEFVDDQREEQEVQNDLKLCIDKAVSLLSPKCRLVFSLSRFEGLTNDEIADHLGLSKRTVETQISQALKLFRTDLRHIFTDFLTTLPFFLAVFIF